MDGVIGQPGLGAVGVNFSDCPNIIFINNGNIPQHPAAVRAVNGVNLPVKIMAGGVHSSGLQGGGVGFYPINQPVDSVVIRSRGH